MIYEKPEAETRPAPPARLYKYMECVRDGKDSGVLRFFKSGMVRFTQPVEFNDPFEMQPFLKELTDQSTIESQFRERLAGALPGLDPKLKSLLDKMTPAQRARFDSEMQSEMPRHLDFVKKGIEIVTPGVGRRIYDTVNENLGTLCLTEEPGSLLMWAHYADEHKGAVVEFDTSHAFFNRRVGPNDDFRHFRQVTYTRERPAVRLAESDAIDFFYFKSTEWKYEHEWRLIVPLSDCSERIDRTPPARPVCLFRVPPECVRSVILGCRMSMMHHYKLSKVLRSNPAYRHVAFERAEPDKRLFKIQRTPIAAEDIDRWLSIASEDLIARIRA